MRKRMVQNVIEPTYFGIGHVLDFKLVSKPCKQVCFCCKFDPKHDRNFIEHDRSTVKACTKEAGPNIYRKLYL